MKQLYLFLSIAACVWAQGAAQPPAGSAPAASLEPGLYAVINTSMGTITAQLFEKEAPMNVRNFVALARGTKPWKDPKTGAMVAKPLYNNITFHRVIPSFMIQTGDPTATGAHDCGIKMKDEIVPSLKFDRPGRLGVANIGAPNTGGCQFFITEVAYPSLDPPNGGYTIFGQVVEGQDIVGKIARVPRDANDKPRTPVKLVSVTIKRVGPEPAAPAAKKAPAGKK
ncbi:MAG TPA: peptidylprolyl isomerase [Bryobacteraceae bacterium]|nr:peptidylprolyl isomerase [Bryobacteraceae bacterium]